MKIFTSSTACSFFLSFFFFIGPWIFVLDYIADRITSRMAFNIFSTSINICSLARYFFFVSFSVWEPRVPLPYGSTRAPTRVFSRYTHTDSLKYTYVRMHGSQSKRDRERKREIFWGLSTDRAEERIKCCRTSANMASCLLVLWSDRSRYPTNLCAHIHIETCPCVWFNVCEGWHRRSRVFWPRGDYLLILGNYKVFH